MPPSNIRSNDDSHSSLNNVRPSLAFVVIIFGALIAFEIFNFSTTDHALGDLLGDLTFAGLPWSTVLAVAFCGIDFAGIARLFTPEQGMDEPKEVWYLFGAWLLAATMNAILTWWGVSIAVAQHGVQSSSVVDPRTITSVVPVFVAIMVWVIRILIIGTLSLTLDRMLHPGLAQRTPLQSVMNTQHTPVHPQPIRQSSIPSGLNSAGLSSRPSVARSASTNSRASNRPAVTPIADADEGLFDNSSHMRPEPSYHSLSSSGRPATSNSGSDRFRRS